MKPIVINLTVFKLAWAATVVSAAAGRPAAGLAAIGAAVAVHLWQSAAVRREAGLLAVAAAVGFAWESALVAAGVLDYGTGQTLPGIAPYWIVGMWVLFATTLNVSLRWLRKGRWTAVVVGAIGGPLSFFAGASAGAVTLADPLISLLVIGAGWAVLLPLMVRFADRLDGRSVAATAEPAGMAPQPGRRA